MNRDDIRPRKSEEARVPLPLEPNLRDVLALLWRRKGLIVATVLLTTLATALVVFQLTPLYTAKARILIAPRAANVVDIDNVLEALRPDRTTVQSEVEVLQSRSLAEKVVGELELVGKPEFNTRLRTPSLRRPGEWLASLSESILAAAGFDSPSTAGMSNARDRDRAVSALLERVSVQVIKVSRVVSVGVTSEDPKLAAKLANALAGVYLREQREEKAEATRQAAAWLNERVNTLRVQVEQSNRAVQDFRGQQGLTETSDATLLEQRISEVNAQLMDAQARTAEADARLAQAHALLETQGGIYGATEVLGSSLIQNMRLQEARLAGDAAKMASEYGDRHPQMINVVEELSDIRAKIAVEVGRIVRGLENGLKIAQTRERTLEGSLDKLKGEAARLTAAQARLGVLEREAAANQSLFDLFLARWKETGDQEDLHSADGRVISAAAVPGSPSWPNRAGAVAIAAVASVVLALLLVFLVEQFFDGGFRSIDQIEQALGFGALGTVPRLAGEASLDEHVLDEPASAFAESLRMLHTGLLLADIDAPSMSVLVTSSMPDEGKTSLSLALARLVANSGRRVLLIDGDLRRGQIGERLGLAEQGGLVDLLTGALTSVDEAIRRDERSGLDVLTAGRRAQPTDVFRSKTMSQLVETLKSSYELIVVDSPPLLHVADARTLARLVDRTVFVVRWADTTRKGVVTGLRMLLESDAEVAGVVLNLVETRSAQPYYYGAESDWGMKKRQRYNAAG